MLLCPANQKRSKAYLKSPSSEKLTSIKESDHELHEPCTSAEISRQRHGKDHLDGRKHSNAAKPKSSSLRHSKESRLSTSTYGTISTTSMLDNPRFSNISNVESIPRIIVDWLAGELRIFSFFQFFYRKLCLFETVSVD